MKIFIFLSALASLSLCSCTTTEQTPETGGKNIDVQASEPAQELKTSVVYLPMP